MNCRPDFSYQCRGRPETNQEQDTVVFLLDQDQEQDIQDPE